MIPIKGGFKSGQEVVIMATNFPEKDWYENLLFDSARETYDAMTPEQKQLIRFAYYYGTLRATKQSGE